MPVTLRRSVDWPVTLDAEVPAPKLGTWGTDMTGQLVDEHHVMFELNPDGEGVTRVVGRGWLAAKHPAVRQAIVLLGQDPTLTGKELSASVGISLSRIVRLFRAELGVSIVEYRNRLRVARIRALFDAGKSNLCEAAREAGFGSYPQFHRVFRAAYGVAPRDYVRAR